MPHCWKSHALADSYDSYFRMDHRTDNNEKAIVCIRQVRRGFLFVFLLMIVAMAVMYGFTEDTVLLRTMNVTTFRNWTIAGGLKGLSSNLTYQTTNKLQDREASPLDVIKYERSQEMNAFVGSGGTRTMSLEYPGMPDPCASPRRNTGVEDLLCMVCVCLQNLSFTQESKRSWRM